MSEQKIYVISHRELEKRRPHHRFPEITRYEKPPDFYKIGISEDPEWRLQNMSSSTPHNLELESVIESDNPSKVEGALHQLFNLQHQSGEWYYLFTNQANSLAAIDRLRYREVRKLQDRYLNAYQIEGSSLYIELMKIRGGKV